MWWKPDWNEFKSEKDASRCRQNSSEEFLWWDNRNEMEARRKYELESLIFVKIEERNYSTLIYWQRWSSRKRRLVLQENEGQCFQRARTGFRVQAERVVLDGSINLCKNRRNEESIGTYTGKGIDMVQKFVETLFHNAAIFLMKWGTVISPE